MYEFCIVRGEWGKDANLFTPTFTGNKYILRHFVCQCVCRKKAQIVFPRWPCLPDPDSHILTIFISHEMQWEEHWQWVGRVFFCWKSTSYEIACPLRKQVLCMHFLQVGKIGFSQRSLGVNCHWHLYEFNIIRKFDVICVYCYCLIMFSNASKSLIFSMGKWG